MGSVVRDAPGRTVATKAPSPELHASAEAAGDPERLIELLGQMQRTASEAGAMARGVWIEFEDRHVEATGTVSFAHGLGGRVRWWVVDWFPDVVAAGDAPALGKSATSTDDVLVLTTRRAGTVTIRIEKVTG